MGDSLSYQSPSVDAARASTPDRDKPKEATLPPPPQSPSAVETFVAKHKPEFFDAKELVPDLNNVSLQMFADQETMQRTLDRIAVFVESDRKGQVLSDEELNNYFSDRNKYHYAGHDYKASDLAAFFNEAENKSIKLNEAELKLRDDLLSRGIITQNSSTKLYEAPVGNKTYIASFYAAKDRHTTITLNHELIHAGFFTDENFANKCREYFNSLPEKFQSQVIDTLGKNGYDKSQQDLMVNEFVAHMLVESTFRKRYDGFLPWGEMNEARVKLRTALSGYNLPEYLDPSQPYS